MIGRWMLAGVLLVPAACFYDPTLPAAEATDGATSAGMSTSTDPSAPTESPTSGTGDPDPGLCGNYEVDPGEGCDLGANNGGGALCKADCQLNTCGDGYLAPAVEGCDDGNLDDDDECTSSCTSKNCGDGMTDGAEQCDDGNAIDDDNCSNLCRLPICGDGVVNGGDECDDPGGNSDTGACTSMCEVAVCGDGLLYEGVEGCDDGNAIDDDSCSNACTTASCGDGVVQEGEACDLGMDNGETAPCLPSCVDAACGDGFVQAGVETCDDGNIDGGDGCSATCVSETCGNGIMDPGEECDDGGMNNGDDCRNDCIAAACGDGIVAVDATEQEQCDDGNAVDSDECPSTCKNATCGDGFVRAGAEECDGGGGATDTCDMACKRSAYWVFVTSTKYRGNQVMGVNYADNVCTMLASGKAIAGVYKAWVSDDMQTVAQRMFHPTVKYILPNKTKVADSWADLTDNSLDMPITYDETGTQVVVNPPPTMCDSGTAEDAAVWTGTLPNGNDGMTCQDWKSNLGSVKGQGGLVNRSDFQWSGCQFSCDTQARLYCVEQPPG